MKTYPKGLYMDKPRENAPKFVKGKLSMKPKEFVDFIKAHKEYINEKGYMKFDLLQSEKDGKLYFTLDTYKVGSNDFSGQPFESKKEQASLEETASQFDVVNYPKDEINPLDIPF